jgi:hypothetical protein
MRGLAVRKRQIAFLIGLAIFVAWNSVWLAGTIWPRVVTTEGAFGPFVIGQTKDEVREILEAHDKWPPSPRVAEDKYLARFDLDALQAAFREENGVIVNFCCAGSNTWLDFEADKLIRIWPDLILDNPHTHIRAAEEDMARFRERLHLGMSKSDALVAISEIVADRKITVSNHLVGAQAFRIRWSEDLGENPAYLEFVQRANGWRLYGFKELAWYAWLNEPFDAWIHLSFKNERLYRIEHYSTPSELP